MASEVVRSRVRWGVVMVAAIGVTLGAVLSERIEERQATRIEEGTSVKAVSPGGPGELLAVWDMPTEYTDDSYLFLKTHEVCWGTQSGSYPNCVDLSTTQYPGMQEYRITNLEIGTQYFVVVRAIDSEDSKSADSTEASLVVTAYIPESITWTDFNGGTISSPGDYRLTGNINSGSGNAISINAGGVRLNCDNNIVTFATSGTGNGINIGTASDDIEIYNCIVNQGGNNLGYGIGRNAITLGNNIKIHDNTINMNFTNYGAVVFDEYDANTSGHEIYRNTIYVTQLFGDSAGIGARERSWTWDGKIYENTIQMENCQYNGSYPMAIWAGRGSEVYKNTITMTADNYQVQGYSGWNVDYVYYHDNTVNSAAELTRIHLLDGGTNNVYILWNDVISTNPGSDVSSPIRIRYGANKLFVGFNDFETTTGSDIACRTGSWDSIKLDAFDLYFYHNQCTGPIAGTIISAAHDFYYWSNTFDGRFDIEGTADPANVSRYLSNLNFHFDTFIGTNITANPRSAGFDLVDNNLTFCQVPNVTTTDDLTWIGSNPNERGGIVFPQSNCAYPVNKVPKAPTGLTLSIPAP